MSEAENQQSGPSDNLQGPEGSQEISLEQIMKECLDSTGYVVFVGRISKQNDPKGNLMLDFFYKRSHFSFEDVKISIGQFEKHLFEDFKNQKEELT